MLTITYKTLYQFLEGIPVCIKLRYLYEWTQYCSLFTAMNEGGLFSLIYRNDTESRCLSSSVQYVSKGLKKKKKTTGSINPHFNCMSILHTISCVAFSVNAFLCYFRFSKISWHSKRLYIAKALINMQDFFFLCIFISKHFDSYCPEYSVWNTLTFCDSIPNTWHGVTLYMG